MSQKSSVMQLPQFVPKALTSDTSTVNATHSAAFVMLGDFNRRLGLPEDWAWRLLSPPSAPSRLLTEGVLFHCDPRFPAFIDHLIAGGGAETTLVEGSFKEWPCRGCHPDHCAVSAVFRTGR